MKRLPLGKRIGKQKSREPSFLFGYRRTTATSGAVARQRSNAAKVDGATVAILDSGVWFILGDTSLRMAYLPAEGGFSTLAMFTAFLLYGMRFVECGNPNFLGMLLG